VPSAVAPTNAAEVAAYPHIGSQYSQVDKSLSQAIRGAVDAESAPVQTVGVAHFGIALKVPLNLTFSP